MCICTVIAIAFTDYDRSQEVATSLKLRWVGSSSASCSKNDFFYCDYI